MQTENSTSSTQPAANPETPTTSPNNAKSNKKIFVFGFAGFLLVAAVLALAVGIARVYTSASRDGLSRVLATGLRLPLAKINGQTILYVEYIKDMDAIARLRAYDKTHNGSTASLTDEQMSDQVLFRLVNNTLVEQAARTFGLKASESEVQSLREQIYQQAASQQNQNSTSTPVVTDEVRNKVNSELFDRYGWTMDEYEKKVMYPFVLERKLADTIDGNQQMRDVVRAKAQNVLDQIKKGDDFAKLAGEYGEDATAKNGGELGWFGHGEMVPQFESAVFALKKGEFTQNLVETPYGFHIIQLEDRKTAPTKDASGKTVQAEQVQARHILFLYPSIQKYLDDALVKSHFNLYVKVHNPLSSIFASSTPAVNQ